MYLLTNGKIILEDKILENYDLLIKDSEIEKIAEKGTIKCEGAEKIDAEGAYITPGFIDIHSDYIETMSSPRPTSVMDFDISFRETEKNLLGCGITTMFHSLSFYGIDLFENKPIRKKENVVKLMQYINASSEKNHLIRHRFHARMEIDSINEVENIKSYIEHGKINLLSFMDHTPGQGQYSDINLYKKIMKGYKDLSDEEIDKMIKERQEKATLTWDTMKEIADDAKRNNISIASHDDDTPQKIELMNELGAVISEFPVTIEAAREAKKKGMYTLAGAPNIILGKSHAGNLSAKEAVKEKCIDILCSDYYPSALLYAVFKLNEDLDMPLYEAFKFTTLNPAKAVKMDKKTGSIKEGKKADILIIEKSDGMPVISKVFIDGKLMLETNYRI